MARSVPAPALLGVVVTLVAALTTLAGCGGHPPTNPAGPPFPAASANSGSGNSYVPDPGTHPRADGVHADWVERENALPGTTAWRIASTATPDIAGFADRTYAAAGQTATLYVTTHADHFQAQVYRMGYYQGSGARLVWTSPPTPGRVQPDCPLTPGINLVSCANWSPSLRVPITADFPQGDYLIKLVESGGAASYVPLTVWDPTSHATYLIKNDVFTWQAWNPYGGYDFYVGQGSCPPRTYPLCSRARVVSYDRPYAFGYNGGQGSGDFLGLELPLVRWMEQRGLDVGYATDVTGVEQPGVFGAHATVLSLGHDECWSLAERDAAVAAQHGGVNFAFFGASAMLRHVRPQPSPLGPDREVVDYRDSTADPLNGHGDPRDVTGNTWSVPPARWPETDFVGEAYNGFLTPNAPRGALRIADPSAWIFAGTGLPADAQVPSVIASDVDSLEPSASHPANVQVLAHSPLDATHAQARTRVGSVFFSDMTYYTDPVSGSAVWDSGTNNWIPTLAPCAPNTTCPAALTGQLTANLLHTLGTPQAGRTRPSVPNWRQFYPGSHS